MVLLYGLVDKMYLERVYGPGLMDLLVTLLLHKSNSAARKIRKKNKNKVSHSIQKLPHIISTYLRGGLSRPRVTHGTGVKGYGHSVIFLAYFLTKLSSLKMNSDRLTVKQFWRTGIGL